MKQINSIIINSIIIVHAQGNLALVFNILFIIILLETISSSTLLQNIEPIGIVHSTSATFP